MNQNLESLVSQWQHERPDLDLQALAISAAIKRLEGLMDVEFRALGQTEFDLGPGDLRILMALRRNGMDSPMRPTDLFQSLLITSGAVTKQVDRLVRKGLVVRRPDPNYKRGRLIGLTEKGREVADQTIGSMWNPTSRLGMAFATLSERDKTVGLSFLRALLAGIESVDADRDPTVVEAEPAPRRKRAKA